MASQFYGPGGSVGEGFQKRLEQANTVAYLFGPEMLQSHKWRRLTPVLDDLVGMMPKEVLDPRGSLEVQTSGSAMSVKNPLFQQGGVLGQRGFDIDSIAELLGVPSSRQQARSIYKDLRF